eukprot:157346_1
MTLSFVLIHIFLWQFRTIICCPTGYTWCIQEKQGNCVESGIIAYGLNTRYTYQTSSGSINCDNAEFGDPVYHSTKECCYQTPTLTGQVSPIVGTISCGETIYSFFKDPSDIHYWKLTTSNFNDITYSTCDSSFNTRITVHNSQGTIISLPYCPESDGPGYEGDNCNEATCSTLNNEFFVIQSQLPNTYYIKIMAYNVSTDVGNYELSVTCSSIEHNFDAIGCWQDHNTNDDPRAMSIEIGKYQTIQTCNEACLKYKYFGMEYGSECFCDNSFIAATQYGRSTNCGICVQTNANCPFIGVGGSWAINLYHNQYDLIFDHKNVSNGYFSINLKTTGIENENDPTANTYCIIGNINPIMYQGNDGKYTFKLIYKYPDDTQDIINWKQSSWITQSVITGADLFDIPTQTSCTQCDTDFEGLGLSNANETYIDGDGDKHMNWYQSIGSNEQWNDGVNWGIPGFNEKAAYSSSLYILNPIVPTLSPTPTPTNNPTMSPSISPTQSPSISPTPSPTFNPTPAPTINPTMSPSISPTQPPSNNPTLAPFVNPSIAPTSPPTLAPSNSPILPPTIAPTYTPSQSPTGTKIVVGTDPTGKPTKSPVMIEKTTTESVDNGNEGNNDGENIQETGGLISGMDMLLMVILSVTVILLICCCFLMILIIVVNRRKRKHKVTRAHMDSDQAEGMSNRIGLTDTNINSIVEMDNMHHVKSVSQVSNTTTSPLDITTPITPYGPPLTMVTGGNDEQQNVTPMGMGVMNGIVPSPLNVIIMPDLPKSSLNLNSNNGYDNRNDKDVLNEDEEDDEMYEPGDQSNEDGNYDQMYGTAGGPTTAGQ